MADCNCGHAWADHRDSQHPNGGGTCSHPDCFCLIYERTDPDG